MKASLNALIVPAVLVSIGLSLILFIYAMTSQAVPEPSDGIIPSNYHYGIAVNNIFETGAGGPFESDQQMKKFSSYSEMTDFLHSVQLYLTKAHGVDDSVFFYYADRGGTLRSASPLIGPSFDSGFAGGLAQQSEQAAMIDSESAGSSLASNDINAFSGTNIQVAGVDEADFLKTDGKYTYILSGSRLTIIDSFPPEDAMVVSKTSLDIVGGQGLQNMFLNGDHLVIFYQDYAVRTDVPEYDYAPRSFSEPSTHAVILDVSDRENPKILRNYEISGQYSNSRMVGNNVFLITTSGVDYQNPVPPVVTESSRIAASADVYYFDNPEQSYAFNTVTQIDLGTIKPDSDIEDELFSETFMIGSGNTIYVSENNIFIAYQENLPYEYYQMNNKEKFSKVIVPLLPIQVQKDIVSIEEDESLDSSEKWDKVSSLLQNTYDDMSENEKSQLFFKMQSGMAEYDSIIARDSQKTIVHKISISGNSVLQYVAKGEVPGRLLNQFSMNENDDGRFSIATTSEYSTPQAYVMHNNVYTLDNEMNMIGRLEGVAPDESIYSARFMGDRLYLVTFQRTDPFFVIDLSDDDPKVMGMLKLPGFSNYLHPYDNDHIIGIGRETKENQYGGVEFLGVKIALFDVTDVNHPRVTDTYMIGDSNTDSEVLRDHKAFLFDKEKNVLSVPIFSPDTGYAYAQPSGGIEEYRQPTSWNGFHVFSIDSDKQFKLEGQIEHENSNYGSYQSRSFYINETLYTVTQSMMKMNELGNLDVEINQISLSGGEEPIKYYFWKAGPRGSAVSR